MEEVDIFVSATVSAYDVVEAFNWDSSRILKFILSMEEEVGDLEFTVELRDKLSKAIEEERA